MRRHEMFARLLAIGLCMTRLVHYTYTPLGFPPYLVPPPIIGLLILGMANVWLVLRGERIASAATLFFVLLAGVGNRVFFQFPVTSDVLAATNEALSVLASGQNPYTHAFTSTVPTGSPFPYLPGELLFYAIPWWFSHSIVGVDKAVGIATIFLLASLAPIVGTARTTLCVALYAMSDLAALTSVNGSNDGSQAFLLIMAVVLAAWSAQAREKHSGRLSRVFWYASAVALAWALLFKAFSWVFLPFFVAYVLRAKGKEGYGYVALVLGIFAVAVTPFLVLAPGDFLLNIYRGFTLHVNIWGLDVWAALAQWGAPLYLYERVIARVGIFAGLAAMVFLLGRKCASLAMVLLYGLGVLSAMLLLIRWSSPDYYAFAITIFIAAIALLDSRESPSEESA